MQKINAFRIHNDNEGYRSGLEAVSLGEIGGGGVLIETQYSSVNYKDALAGTGRGKIVRRFPLIGGIDCAGTVAESDDPRFRPGDVVLATGYGLGVSHDGGYSPYVRLPAGWVVAMPQGLEPRSAMLLGTAGFAACLALLRMERNGQTPELGPIAVTGASGGVGSLAVMLFSRLGYEVVAISGKPERWAWLERLGAARVIGRDELELSDHPLDRSYWGGIVDNAGGEILAGLLPQIARGGNVAAIGLAAGHELITSVMPFILRGVSLLGVNSADSLHDTRLAVWERLSCILGSHSLDLILNREIGLDGLPAAFDQILAGRVWGRVLVRTR
ncbi:MAG: quinone oxidoreductase [Gammaproteobacteria bacterium RIFOXYA12_FULL_61_12]|nr:MAG: quinone oxidoreductase [Gammaproteobacteria bacterium RIFOXYA12_FULL_61_12]OGT90971.1 MAG: quinone oxidoreductase [Gammaproteobacteria bacterium RIFOXYD12_FULL_61_37]